MPTTTGRSVLISGASIAGPALAYWLRAHGFTPTVVERAPRLRDGGYAVDVCGIAVDVVERMGLLPAVRRAGTQTRTLSTIGRDGRRSAEVDISVFGSGPSASNVELMRGHLSRIFHQATEDGAEYVFDDSITAMEETTDGVRVTFENSAPRTFGLVVGADGLHSNVRRLAFGPEGNFRRYLGRYVSIFSVPNDLGLDREVRLYNTPHRLTALHCSAPHTGRIEPPRPGEENDPGTNPVAKAMFVFTTRREVPVDHRDVAAQQRIVSAVFAREGWEAPRLLRAMRDADDFYFDSVSQIHMDRWSRGRIALVGDAAYCPSPMSGQGTSVGSVGAYVLAGELAAADGDHTAAFRRYESLMRRYVHANQAIAAKGSRVLIPATPTGIRLRDQAFRLTNYLPGLTGLGQDIDRASNGMALPDYPVNDE
ncbi:2-polyprenyl-6-methoxyphenol hydroxylase-like FAD-dependent oxidoreductase [Nocardiopsis mwathae]|uniref:2-polyprenyl-6-methoxyphenol hydroxylase-like FAD-dependent oxidoreductase n=1 Tax=Nocardiopsis mwathae TaxID=1472723 RepID=A0A7W9YL11_9ACTN|nr:FAD-dependent monooxygenase [Nocardiopsis mwathae]MBB6173491.1 2-polyprenyl-6-methoxyphenol hydroxylase-like FAD-dependent oxidoreductase [Nocardiopsis mwathae]